MIPEIGHLALCLALAAALVQALVPMLGRWRRDAAWVAVAGPAAGVQCLMVAAAFAALTWCYYVSDFSVLNVVANSHTMKPMLYKITGVWGNHEGSLLLWVLILALAGAAVAWFGRHLPPLFLSTVLAVQALVALGFYAFMLFTSNPFARVMPAELEGNGLNPILQDPGLAFHPPLLYMGYVGLSVTFSFAVAALIDGRIGPAWARWVRPWTLAAWAFLTLGIALGSWWAYYELGWGGWWFWDPVENASLMPWLAATALFHSAVVLEKRDALKSWTVLLAILAFSLSLIGTFIVRSGVLTSVHAFAVDPERGVFILGLLALYIGGALALFAWRAARLEAGGAFAAVSREGALVANNLLLCAALGTVFIGTLYPLALEGFAGEQISVGPPYFNATFIPLMTPLIILMAAGPLLSWRAADGRAALRQLVGSALFTGLVILALLFGSHAHAALELLGFGLAAWAGSAVLIDLLRRLRFGEGGFAATFGRLRRIPGGVWGMLTAHLGVAVSVFGITASGAWQSQALIALPAGGTAAVGPFTFTLADVQPVAGPNFTALEATVTVAKADGQLVATLRPQARTYTSPPMETTEAGIRPLLTGDLYAVIGQPDGTNRWSVRFHWKPYVALIWAGAGLMALGGAFSLADRRLRVAAPARKGAPQALPQPAE